MPTDQQISELDRRLTRLEPLARRGVPVPAPLPALGRGALLTGAGPPDASVGEDGAMYLDTSSGAVYGPKSVGWPDPTWQLTPIA
jgi:hypothetical protein